MPSGEGPDRLHAPTYGRTAGDPWRYRLNATARASDNKGRYVHFPRALLLAGERYDFLFAVLSDRSSGGRDAVAVPVIDENGRPVGMINGPRHLRVVSAGPTDTLAAAEALMKKHQVRRLPVIDKGGVRSHLSERPRTVRRWLRPRHRAVRDERVAVLAAHNHVAEPHSAQP
jgi:hypothetical protein